MKIFYLVIVSVFIGYSITFIDTFDTIFNDIYPNGNWFEFHGEIAHKMNNEIFERLFDVIHYNNFYYLVIRNSARVILFFMIIYGIATLAAKNEINKKFP